jgi:hypothetical protein
VRAGEAMSESRYASRFRYLDAADVDDAVVNFDRLAVVGADGEMIGDVEGFVVDVYAQRVIHIVVDAGVRFDLRRFLLPIGHAAIATDRKSLRTDVTRLALRYLPEFEADRFCEFTDEELHAFERNTVIACCPDQPLEAVVEPTWGYECWGHYRQPDWWSMDRCATDRLRSLAGTIAGSCRNDRLAGVGTPRRNARH